MLFGYVRVSTQDQDVENQKNEISRYCIDRKMIIDEWIAIEISSSKSTEARRIDELISKLKEDDAVIASELSRLGRSIKETLDIVETIVEKKKARLILIKQNLDLNPHNLDDMQNTVLLTTFSMLAKLERTFISQRTKTALRARIDKGIKLGKPVGIIQKSMFDNDEYKIFHLLELGVPVNKISRMYLKYGTDESLRYFIKTRRKRHYEEFPD